VMRVRRPHPSALGAVAGGVLLPPLAPRVLDYRSDASVAQGIEHWFPVPAVGRSNRLGGTFYCPGGGARDARPTRAFAFPGATPRRDAAEPCPPAWRPPRGRSAAHHRSAR